MEEGPESQVSCGARQPRRWSARRPLLLTVLLCLVALMSGLLGLHLRARMHWHAAQEALDRYDLDQAQAHLNAYLWYRPRDAAALLVAAQTARRRGAAHEAERRR